MKNRYTYILLTLAVIILLSGFSSEKDSFPAPIKEPVAAVYVNLLPSGIFDEENQKACEEIANNVAKICKMRDNNVASLSTKEYRDITLNILKNSIINGFLQIHEIYFYYKNQEEFALIALGEFDTLTIAEKLKAQMLFDKEDKLIKLTTTIKANNGSNEKLLLEASNNLLVISPERSESNIFNVLKDNKNLLGDKFKTFEKMLQHNPAISAEIDIEQLLKNQNGTNIPKPVTATKLVRLFVAPLQNKLQISIPEDNDREELKKELQNQTILLNSLFDNKTDYKLAEGKTSIFIESKTDEEQVQEISRKTMAFMLHFFVKNISSNQH